MQKTLEFRRPTGSGAQADASPSSEQRAQLRLMARDVLGDVENLFAQHITLTKLEVQKSMQSVKVSVALLGLSSLLGVIGLVSVLRSLALAMSAAFEWSPATAELVNGLLIFLVAGIAAYVGIKAVKKLSRLPEKILNQWKEEWQWLRKNL